MFGWHEWRVKLTELAKKEAVSHFLIKKLLMGIENGETFPYPDGRYTHS